MEIKNPVSIRTAVPDSTAIRETTKPKTSFSSSKGKPEATDGTFKVQLLPDVAASFKRKDLHNPALRETVVRQALDELLTNEVPGTASLHGTDRTQLTGWMAQDPIIQSRMLNFLDRTLE